MTKFSAHLLMLLAAFIWGTTFVAQATGMETLGPFSFTAARYFIGALAIFPLAMWEARRVNLRENLAGMAGMKLQILGLGLLMFGGIAFQQMALQWTNVANSAFFTALYVPFVPIMAWAIHKTPLSAPVGFALLLCVSGSYLLAYRGDLSAQLGDILTAIGALFWAGHIILVGVVTHKLKAPFQLSLIQSLVCVGCAGPFLLIEQPHWVDFLPVFPELIYAGFVSVGIGFTLQLIAQAHATPTIAAFILSLEAVFAAWAGWLILGQVLSVAGIIGCGLIFAGVLCAEILPARNKQKNKKKREKRGITP